MYCRNCGKAMDVEEKICKDCGIPVGYGSAYCQNCGTSVTQGSAECTVCGLSVYTDTVSSVRDDGIKIQGTKSRTLAAVLGIFLGAFGVHSFYLGYKLKGLFQFFVTLWTCGIGGIWGLIEGILILGGKINTDADGNLLRD
ncbi:MAG: NINE protein [Ruminococcus flavefaciens]|nr:NINE protein [Ruminococcus flavefaciens]MCM1229613.1 NINE protein [Ruminococcus flavefaciens]